MAHSNTFCSFLLATLNFQTLIVFHFLFVSWLLFLPFTKSLNFSFLDFKDSRQYMDFANDSYPTPDGVIQLTKNQLNLPSGSSVGRASYKKPLHLWDKATGELTNFSTTFSFQMLRMDGDNRFAGDGITFFLAAPFDSSSSAPYNSTGGCLGLVSGAFCNITSKDSPFVAVEFDTYLNYMWDDPDMFGSHVGIDVNSVRSVNVTSAPGLENVSLANAHLTYDSSDRNLSVVLRYGNYSPVFFSHVIDLREVLPEKVRVGFSGSTGSNFEIHNTFSWEFNSTLVDVKPTPAPAPAPAPVAAQAQPLNGQRRKSKKRGLLVLVGVVVALICVLAIVGLALIGFMWRTRRSTSKDDNLDSDGYGDFENGTGPRRFAYRELSCATNNFDEEQKLGEGGFGGVYFGLLSDSSTEIAVKKVSRGSKQGKKEFVSEVKVISRLRHRNLVQLLGWCHERGDLLLVYEFMPNGSLDSHLYGVKKEVLPWTVRCKIALGLASALLYLQEEWEQCVVHRDIKSSNIMLDSNFNAKLGDFGLARLVDHELGSQTTILAGTFGYLAPECAITGKASKESDVYSFGVVVLEIVCGRRPIQTKVEPSKVRMVEWVWDLYGRGLLPEAVDRRLEGEFNVQQTECLMMVGLWCCHPDHTLRPTMSQVTSVLKSEATLPTLPAKFPVPVYLSPPVTIEMFSSPSSSGFTSSSGTTSSSAQSVVSGAAPLLSSI